MRRYKASASVGIVMASINELQTKCSLRRLSELETEKALETAIRNAILNKISRLTASMELAEAQGRPRNEIDALIREAGFLDFTIQHKLSRLARNALESGWLMRTFGVTNPLT